MKINLLIRKRRPFADYLIGEIHVDKKCLEGMINKGLFDVWEILKHGKVVFSSDDEKGVKKWLNRNKFSLKRIF